MTKEQLIKYGERMAPRYVTAKQDGFFVDEQSKGVYRNGFNACIELMWPLVEALERLSHHPGCFGEDAKIELKTLEQKIGESK